MTFCTWVIPWKTSRLAAGSWGQRASQYARVLLPGLAGTLAQAAEALGARPTVAAAALAAFALASPSVLAAGEKIVRFCKRTVSHSRWMPCCQVSPAQLPVMPVSAGVHECLAVEQRAHARAEELAALGC